MYPPVAWLIFQGIDFGHTAVDTAVTDVLPPVKAGDGIVVVGRGPKIMGTAIGSIGNPGGIW